MVINMKCSLLCTGTHLTIFQYAKWHRMRLHMSRELNSPGIFSLTFEMKCHAVLSYLSFILPCLLVPYKSVSLHNEIVMKRIVQSYFSYWSKAVDMTDSTTLLILQAIWGAFVILVRRWAEHWSISGPGDKSRLSGSCWALTYRPPAECYSH